MLIYYRLSDNSYPKLRFENATKENCLRNFLTHFNDSEDRFVLVLDNARDETYDRCVTILKEMRVQMDTRIKRTHAGSSAGSFRIVFADALQKNDSEYVYFVEDDYAHLPNSRQVLLEGLERAHYVTLYNHPDKYIPASQGGNPLIQDDGAEVTKVFVTRSSYWMLTNSTTMTVASLVGTLREDQATWMKYTEGTHPQDMLLFFDLRSKGRGLIQPIPTKATHCEPRWAAHLFGTGYISWNDVLTFTSGAVI